MSHEKKKTEKQLLGLSLSQSLNAEEAPTTPAIEPKKRTPAAVVTRLENALATTTKKLDSLLDPVDTPKDPATEVPRVHHSIFKDKQGIFEDEDFEFNFNIKRPDCTVDKFSTSYYQSLGKRQRQDEMQGAFLLGIDQINFDSIKPTLVQQEKERSAFKITNEQKIKKPVMLEEEKKGDKEVEKGEIPFKLNVSEDENALRDALNEASEKEAEAEPAPLNPKDYAEKTYNAIAYEQGKLEESTFEGKIAIIIQVGLANYSPSEKVEILNGMYHYLQSQVPISKHIYFFIAQAPTSSENRTFEFHFSETAIHAEDMMAFVVSTWAQTSFPKPSGFTLVLQEEYDAPPFLQKPYKMTKDSVLYLGTVRSMVSEFKQPKRKIRIFDIGTVENKITPFASLMYHLDDTFNQLKEGHREDLFPFKGIKEPLYSHRLPTIGMRDKIEYPRFKITHMVRDMIAEENNHQHFEWFVSHQNNKKYCLYYK